MENVKNQNRCKAIPFKPGDTVYAIARKRQRDRNKKMYSRHNPLEMSLYQAQVFETISTNDSKGNPTVYFRASTIFDESYLVLDNLTADTCFDNIADAQKALEYYQKHGYIRIDLDGNVVTVDGAPGYLQSIAETAAAKRPPQLSGREIQNGDFVVDNYNEGIVWMENILPDEEDGWNIYLTAQCNVDEIFGTHVETDENDDYLNCYINVSADCSRINPVMDVIFWRDDDCIEMERPLTEHEQTVLRNTARKGMIAALQHDCKREA